LIFHEVTDKNKLAPFYGSWSNFATLNRGRHLYSAGRPSRWALAYILVMHVLCMSTDMVNKDHQFIVTEI